MARYSGLRQECAKALDKDFLDLSVPERLALVQVLHAMGPEGQVVVRGSDVFCPRPSPKKDAPLMLVAEPGSVCVPGGCLCVFMFMLFWFRVNQGCVTLRPHPHAVAFVQKRMQHCDCSRAQGCQKVAARRTRGGACV